MGLLQFNCCHPEASDNFEVKNLTSSLVSARSPESSSVVDKQNVSAHALEFIGQDGASDFTKNSSSAQTSKETKKVLQFRLFKSLRQAGDMLTKYQVGRVLGKGSFGEVRECLNTQTGVTCAIKIVSKEYIG